VLRAAGLGLREFSSREELGTAIEPAGFNGNHSMRDARRATPYSFESNDQSGYHAAWISEGTKLFPSRAREEAEVLSEPRPKGRDPAR